ncbi:HNH/ENDO VII family nuclease [Shewanella sp. 1CM18E]|uniref:HNH/ENDO VII family nuclease n=1 Tax=Shewanella sp. 1CM18E TaxID=2929169 RepID=UPI0020BE5623|nr:HNH/ENDO VII family nuclease [Shewanella sp. 1CM18E]MCK8045342.1 HNH/ENDO VII family nuclease [Shewanella sp. 1CM18E]
MDILAFKEVVSELPPAIFNSFEKTEITKEALNELDKPITDKLNIREELEPLSEEYKAELQELGYSESVIDAIGSKEEADIYGEAELECITLNDKDALIRTDIDLELEDDFGNTNLERMEKGKSPLDQNGKPYELHHIGQTADAPLAELTKTEHISNGNDSVLHDKQKESEIDRTEFAKERAEHWKARAEDIKQELNLGLNNE